MKTRFLILYGLLICSLSSFKITEECEYAGSNMGYVKTQTKKAISASEISKSNFLAYKAINALEKSKGQFDDCGCADAQSFMEEALEKLKMATRATSLSANRILLNQSLEKTLAALEAIEEHEQHRGPYATDVLVLNTVDSDRIEEPKEIIEGRRLKETIDVSLLSYEASIKTVIETVECTEARAFATRIYEHCEEQLLRDDLTEGKKYYNLRTKEITEAALKQLGDCPSR